MPVSDFSALLTREASLQPSQFARVLKRRGERYAVFSVCRQWASAEMEVPPSRLRRFGATDFATYRLACLAEARRFLRLACLDEARRSRAKSDWLRGIRTDTRRLAHSASGMDRTERLVLRSRPLFTNARRVSTRPS